LGEMIKASSYHPTIVDEENQIALDTSGKWVELSQDDLDKLEALADFIRLKFKSGNSVPIDRVVIRLEEVEKWL